MEDKNEISTDMKNENLRKPTVLSDGEDRDKAGALAEVTIVSRGGCLIGPGPRRFQGVAGSARGLADGAQIDLPYNGGWL